MPVRSAFIAGLILASLLPMSAFGQAPSIAKGGVLHAADYSSNIAPGAMVSVFGSNLAPATIKASSLPLPSTLSGVSVDVVASSSTLSAPLYFISPGQINVQLPFDAPVGTVQVRVRTAAGTSNSEPISLIARAPAMFTKNMLGSGEVIAFHADYTAVAADKPAAAGEVIFVYASGLGAVEPAIGAGRPGGDGASGGPLNWVKDPVTVLVGGVASPQVWYAGLAPGFPGVYQINFQIPSSVQAGQYELKVQVAGRTSVAGVTVAGGVPAIKLYDNTNAAGCNLTSTSQFHLDKDAHVASVDTWYHWSPGESSVGYRLSGASGDVSAGTMQRIACDPIQTSWCFAETIAHADLAAGDYTLTMARSQMCANSGSANQGFVDLYGIWRDTGWTDVASAAIGAAGGTVSGGGFSLTVPAGAFTAAANIQVQKSKADPAPDAPTGRFTLSGLPSTCSKPLELSLDIVRPDIVRDLTFLAFGGDSDQQLGPEWIPATVGGGRLTATIPASSTAGGAQPSMAKNTAQAAADTTAPPIAVGSATGFVAQTSNTAPLFNIYFGSGVQSVQSVDLPVVRSSIWSALDQTYNLLGPGDYFKTLGLDWSKRTKSVIHVYVYPFFKDGRPDTETWGCTSQIYWNRQNQEIELNSRKISITDLESLKTSAGHELFHLLQNLYDPRGDIAMGRGPGPWFWFEEAASTWIERLISNNPGSFVPPTAKDNFNFLHVHGLEYPPGTKFEVEQHGYGASMFLEHASTRGLGYIGDVMKHMPDVGVSPAQAFVLEERKRASSMVDLWAGFCSKFLGKNVYSGVVFPTQVLIDDLTAPTVAGAVPRRGTISPKASTGATSLSFSTTRPSLSAEFFRIDFADTSSWSDSTDLIVRVGSRYPALTPAVVYHYNKVTNSWDYIGATTDTNFSVTVSHIEGYKPNVDFLYIMVVNAEALEPFDQTEAITLDVKVDNIPSVLPWLQASRGFIADFSGPHQCKDTGPGATGTVSRCGSSFLVVSSDYKADSSSQSLSSVNAAPSWKNGTDFSLHVANAPIAMYQFDTVSIDANGTFSQDGRTLQTATLSIVMTAQWPDKSSEVRKVAYTLTNVATNQTPGTVTPSLAFAPALGEDPLKHVSGVTYYDMSYKANGDVVSGWMYTDTPAMATIPASLGITFYK